MSLKDEKRYWDQAAADPDVEEKYICNLPLEDCLLGLMSGVELESDDWVLDIGCGIGRLTSALAESYPEVNFYGVDISKEMIEQAPGFDNVTYQVNDGRTLPQMPKINFAYSMLVFQHMPPDAVEGYIEDVAEKLVPGGKFRFQFVEGSHHSLVNHNHDSNQIIQWLEDNGFNIKYVDVGLIHPQWTWITAVKR